MNVHRRVRRGATLTNYALVLAAIVVLVIGIITQLGGSVSAQYSAVTDGVEGVSTGGSGGEESGSNPAEFTFTPATPFTGQTVNFDGPGTATNWNWDFDGDTVVDSTLEDPTHTFSGTGAHTVTLETNEGTYALAIEVFDGILDSFNRTVASGWGTSSSGAAWTTNDDSYFSVDGDQGLMGYDADAPLSLQAEIPISPIDVGEVFTVTFTMTDVWAPTTEESEFSLFCGDFNFLYYWRSDNHYFEVGNSDDSGLDATEHTYTLGQPHHVKFEVDGTNVRGRMWPTTEAEPATWQAVELSSAPRTEPVTSCFFRRIEGALNDTSDSTIMINDFDVEVSE